MKSYKIFIGILVIFIIAVIFYIFHYYNWHGHLTLISLKENAKHLRGYVQQNYFKSVLIYIGTYIIISMLPIPGDTVFNIAGGYLFGAVTATFYINFSMTVAATIMFLLVRYFGKNLLQNNTTRMILWIRRQIQSHGRYYFLMIRLIPLIPISFVNIAAGLTRIKTQTFIWTTSLGLLPISFILAYSGQELRTIKNIDDIFSFRIILILVVLAFITMSPLLFNILFRKKSQTNSVSEKS